MRPPNFVIFATYFKSKHYHLHHPYLGVTALLSSAGETTAIQLVRNSSALLFLAESFQNFRAGCESGRKFGVSCAGMLHVGAAPALPRTPLAESPGSSSNQPGLFTDPSFSPAV